jgi:hypothetical protein
MLFFHNPCRSVVIHDETTDCHGLDGLPRMFSIRAESVTSVPIRGLFNIFCCDKLTEQANLRHYNHYRRCAVS